MKPDVTFLDGAVRRADVRPVVIYALCDPESGERRYVGKTTARPGRRLIEHGNAAKRSPRPVGRWIRKLWDRGLRPRIEILECMSSDDDWAAREMAWIRTLPKARRLNLTDGGEGLHGLKIAGTLHAARIAAAHRTGAHFNCEVCGAQFWRKQNEIRKGDCRFCSRVCYAIWQKGKHKPVPRACIERGVAVIAARRRALTHCKRDHPLSGANLYINTMGRRVCKECRKLHKHQHRERRRG